jgi:hypothetical protein
MVAGRVMDVSEDMDALHRVVFGSAVILRFCIASAPQARVFPHQVIRVSRGGISLEAVPPIHAQDPGVQATARYSQSIADDTHAPFYHGKGAENARRGNQ